MHAVAAVHVGKARTGHIAGLDLRYAQKRRVEQTEGGGKDRHRAVGHRLGDIIRHARDHAVLKELVVLQIRHGLAGEILHDQLRHAAHDVVFRRGEHVVVMLEQDEDHGRGEALELLHAVDVEKRDGLPAALGDLLADGKRVFDALFDDRLIAGLFEFPGFLDVLHALGDLVRLQRVERADHLEHLIRLDLDAELAAHGVALILRAEQQHIAVAHRADARVAQGAPGRAGGNECVELRARIVFADDVVNILEIVAERLERRADSRGTGLLGSGDDAPVFLPAAQAPQEHGDMAVLVGHADDGVRRDPACHADDQAAHIKAAQLFRRRVGGRVFFIVDDEPCVQQVIAHVLQNTQRLIVLHLQPLDRRVDLSETNKSYPFIHVSLPPCFHLQLLLGS